MSDGTKRPLSRLRDRLKRGLDVGLDYQASRPRAMFAALGLLLAVQIGPWWYSYPDSAQYLSIARTLWTDEGPRSLGNPFLFYPLGYPLLLSPAFSLGERPFAAIGVVQWLAAMVATAGIYRWALRFGPRVAWFAATFTVAHACFGLYYRSPLSEIAFMAAFYWSAVVLDRVRTAATGRRRIVLAIGGTFLILAACQLRPNGITLAPGFAVALAIHAWRMKRRQTNSSPGERELHSPSVPTGRGGGEGDARDARSDEPLSLPNALAYGLVIGLIAAIAFVATRRLDNQRAIAAGGVTQFDYMTKVQPAGVTGSLVDRAVEGVRIQLLENLRVVVPGALKTHVKAGQWGKPNTWLSMALSIPLAIGLLRLLIRTGDVMIWTAVFYLGLNVIWCGDQGGRYTLPILPVIAVAIWEVAAAHRPRLARWIPIFVALHAVAGVGYWLAIDLPRTRAANARWADIDALAAQIDHDRDRVALSGLPGPDANLWRSSLDRQVHDRDLDSAAAREEIRWLVTWQSGDPMPDFEPVASEGGYRLWRRVNP